MDEKAERKNDAFIYMKPARFLVTWVMIGAFFAIPILTFIALTAKLVLATLSQDFFFVTQNISCLGIFGLIAFWLSLKQKQLLQKAFKLKIAHWLKWFMGSLLLMAVIPNSSINNLFTLTGRMRSDFYTLPLCSSSFLYIDNCKSDESLLASPVTLIFQENTCFFSVNGELSENYLNSDRNDAIEISVTNYLQNLKDFIGLSIALLLIFQLLNHLMQAQALKAELEALHLWVLIPTIAAFPFVLSWIAAWTAYTPDISPCEPTLGLFLQAIQILGNPVMLLLTFLLIPISEALVLIHLAKYHRREIPTA